MSDPMRLEKTRLAAPMRLIPLLSPNPMFLTTAVVKNNSRFGRSAHRRSNAGLGMPTRKSSVWRRWAHNTRFSRHWAPLTRAVSA